MTETAGPQALSDCTDQGLAESTSQVLRAEGRLAAIRHVRRLHKHLGVVAARTYVLAVEGGERPVRPGVLRCRGGAARR